MDGEDQGEAAVRYPIKLNITMNLIFKVLIQIEQFSNFAISKARCLSREFS